MFKIFLLDRILIDYLLTCISEVFLGLGPYSSNKRFSKEKSKHLSRIISISKHTSLILYNIISFLTFKVLSQPTCYRSHRVPPTSLSLPQRKTMGCHNPKGLNLQQGCAVTLGDPIALTADKVLGTLGRMRGALEHRLLTPGHVCVSSLLLSSFYIICFHPFLCTDRLCCQSQ